jgi:hypothetical protein
MSGFVMGRVWTLELSKGQQTVLLALADHAHDDGTSVFPSIGYTAWKTGYQRRHVQRMFRELQEAGVLVEVAPATRRLPTEYRIVIEAGREKVPYDARGDIDDKEGRPNGASGAVPRTPKPSKEPSKEPGRSSERENIDHIWTHYANLMHVRRPRNADDVRIIRGALAVATPAECRLAIYGCSRADFHMKRGDSEGRSGPKYNKLSQILKGKRGGKTTREQIEMFVEIARANTDPPTKGKPSTVFDEETAAEGRRALGRE